MSINVGEAEIIVEADGSGVLPEIKSLFEAISKLGKRHSDSLSKSFDKMGFSMERSTQSIGFKLQALVGIMPLITSGASALTGAVVALGSSLARAALSSASLVGIIGALATGAIAAKIGFTGFFEAVKGGGVLIDNLPKQAQGAANALRGLKDQAKGLQQSVQGAIFARLGDDITRVGKTLLPLLKAQLTQTGTVLNGIFVDLGKFLTAEQNVKKFKQALAGSNQILGILGKAARPLLSGLLTLFVALQPAARRFAKVIVEGAQSFNGWTKGEGFAGRINKAMVEAAHSMSLLWKLAKNVGSILKGLFTSTADAGDGLMQTLVNITGQFATFVNSASGQSSIAKWAQTGIDAVKKLGSILGALGGFLGPIFNPAIIDTFLGVLQGLGPTMKTVFGVLQAAIQPVLDSLGPAFAELGPKIAKLFVALAPLLKGLGAVLGQIIKQAAEGIGFLLDIITPVVGVLSKVLGPVIEKLAPVIAFLILGFTNFGSALVKIIPFVGRFISPLVKLYEVLFSKVVSAVAKALPLIAKLGPVFSKVAGALQPFITAMVNSAGFASTAFKAIVKAAQWLWDVLFGHSIFPDIIAALAAFVGVFKTLFTAWTAIFTFALNIIKTVMQTIWNGIKTVWNGISATISGAVKVVSAVIKFYFNLYKTIIMTALKIILTVVKAVWGNLKGVIADGLNAAKSVVSKVWNSIKSVTSSVWNGIKAVITGVVKAVVAVFKGWANIVGYVKGVFSNIVQAIKEKVGQIKDSVKKILTDIKNVFSGAITVLADAGRQLIQGLINGIGEKMGEAVQKVKDGLSKIKKLLPGSPIKDGPLKAWNGGKPGKALMLLLAYGIEKGIPALRKAAASAAGAIAQGLTTGLVEGRIGDQFDAIKEQIAKSLEDKKISQAAAKSMTKAVEHIEKNLRPLIKAYQTATAKLAELRQAHADMLSSISDSLRGEFSFGDAADANGNFTFDAISARVKAIGARIAAFSGKLKALLARGIPKELVAEVAALGSDTGSKVADALMGASDAQVGELVTDWQALRTSANEAGTVMADAFFNTGIAAQEGLIKGLLDDKRLDAAAKALAEKLTKAIKKALGIKSPSKVMMNEVGQPMGVGAGIGLLRGMDEMQKEINRRARALLAPLAVARTRAPVPVGSAVTSSGATVSAPQRVTEHVTIEQNYYGPTSGNGRLREIDWTLRYATRARNERTGLATA